jgi:hypothetical protein
VKIDNDMRYPHPVLNENTGDYRTARFSIEFEVNETFSKDQLRLDYLFVLIEQAIFQLVREKRAAIGVFVTCRKTYFLRLVTLDPMANYFDFAPGQLRGRVTLRPMIWATENLSEFNSDNLHEEFAGTSWDLPQGAILALAEESVINVGREKLAPMATIFSLAENPDVPEGETAIDLGQDKIVINASGATYHAITELRALNPQTQVVLLNSVFLPAVMEVLANLRDGGTSQFSDRRWFRIFSAKCDHLNINMENSDVLKDAQKLLKSPFGKIVKYKESFAS